MRVRYGAELADPLVDIRDIVETYRRYKLSPPEWADSLAAAVAALDRLPPDLRASAGTAELVALLRLLLARGLQSQAEVLDQVADRVAELLRQTHIPGIPRPEDQHWEFGDTATPHA
jgi:hypothetical protein